MPSQRYNSVMPSSQQRLSRIILMVMMNQKLYHIKSTTLAPLVLMSDSLDMKNGANRDNALPLISLCAF